MVSNLKKANTTAPFGNTDSERVFCFDINWNNCTAVLSTNCRWADYLPKWPHSPPKSATTNYSISCCPTEKSCLPTPALCCITSSVSSAPFGEAHLIDNDVTVDFAAATTPTTA
nr:class II glutamine amidotransferase [Eikenella sp. NML03-A-027]